MSNKELVNQAVIAMKNAYAPYSHYTVGAALLTATGRVYLGCNIENSAYSPSNCAERTAFFKAISEGEHDFSKIAIVGGKNGLLKSNFPPCGVCRQVMREFCNPDSFEIVLGNENSISVYKLSDLLPLSFNIEDDE